MTIIQHCNQRYIVRIGLQEILGTYLRREQGLMKSFLQLRVEALRSVEDDALEHLVKHLESRELSQGFEVEVLPFHSLHHSACMCNGDNSSEFRCMGCVSSTLQCLYCACWNVSEARCSRYVSPVIRFSEYFPQSWSGLVTGTKQTIL